MPSRKAPAVARVSALPNTGPIRSLSATSSRSQATSEPDQTATDIDAPPLPDSPRRGPYWQYRCNCSTSPRIFIFHILPGREKPFGEAELQGSLGVEPQRIQIEDDEVVVFVPHRGH